MTGFYSGQTSFLRNISQSCEEVPLLSKVRGCRDCAVEQQANSSTHFSDSEVSKHLVAQCISSLLAESCS